MNKLDDTDSLIELMKARPISIVRNGYAIVFTFVVLVFILSWVVRYPVREKFSVRLITTTAPRDFTIRYEITGEPLAIQGIKINQNVVLRYHKKGLTQTEFLYGKVSSIIVSKSAEITPVVTVNLHHKTDSFWINYTDNQIVAEIITGKRRLMDNILDKIRISEK